MNKIKTLTIILALILGINVYAATSSSQIAVNTTTPTQSTQTVQNYITVNPLDVVARPNFYLNKNIKIKAKFDKFSTLGLDYNPAMRSYDNYISFLIQRPDVTDHNIPLSELKIFLNRTEAEKHIDLNSGDVIEFTGKVFSNALGDPWMDVDKFTVISTKPKTDNK